VPIWQGEPQPMCAVYSDECIGVLENLLKRENFALKDLAKEVSARYVPESDMRSFDPKGLSFMDIDTVEDHLKAEATCGD
jgi:molybdopterin-guanine dinucleotide biosynthesis protein A